MTRVWAIAVNTFREAVRDKVLYALLFFALLMIAGSAVVAELTVGEYHKIIKDFGLAAINLFGLAIAIFVGIGLVSKEIERKTIYTIASKPVARWQFVLGRYLGLVLTLLAEIAAMGAGFVLMTLATRTTLGLAFLPALLLTLVELMVVTAFAVLFSCFSNPLLSAFFTVGFVVIGRLSPELKQLAESGHSEALLLFARILYRATPDLGTFDTRTEAAYGLAIGWEYLGYATGYDLLWAAALLVMAVLVFQKRDFR